LVGREAAGGPHKRQVTDQLHEAEAAPDLDREQRITTGILVVSIAVLGLVPGLLGSIIEQAMPWLLEGVR
jgi:NADH:ubiquinone oxidoreductase subunit 4 (subunit M)